MNTVQPTAPSTILVQGRNSYLLQHEVPGMPNTANINYTTTVIPTDTAVTTGIANTTNTTVQKSLYSAPSLLNYSTASNDTRSPTASSTTVTGINGTCYRRAQCSSTATTPKKHQLRKIRELLLSPGGCDWQALRLEVESVDVIKDRYLISSMPNNISVAAATKTPISYRHLIDLSSARLKCTDVFTEEHFLCKIINEPIHKVQLAYFQLQRDSEGCRSFLYGHNLIRPIRDIVPMSKNRTYMIIPATVANNDNGSEAAPDAAERVYEDLHTYVRNKKCLAESEARALFHQICQTVQVCHRNGIILRDLKLKRFYFIDEARTKLQYESLEGSMILDNPEDDTLSDKIGCPLYTAPELLCPNPTYNGKPADMWSLGVILYTMLVGRYPFYEKGNCSLIRIIRHVNVSIPSVISRPARWLLLNLLRKNYEERLRADCIFLVPWLRQQRMLYVPVDVIIPDDNTDDEGNDNKQMMDIEPLEPLDYSYNDLQRLIVDLTQLSAEQHQQHDGNELLHSINSNVGTG